MIDTLNCLIHGQKVSNKSADITRNTVQKSVCVLSSLPIYGYIQVSLFHYFTFSVMTALWYPHFVGIEFISTTTT